MGHLSKIIVDGQEVDKTGPVGPFEFLTRIEDSEVVRFTKMAFTDGEDRVTVWYQDVTSGKDVMKPVLLYKLSKDAGAKFWDRLNFLSLMLALFLGTSALPHILIRYYTVPSQRAARKSTIVAIAAIGFFYILTLYMGLGSMINGVLDVESSNMSGPLLARSFGIGLFSIISAIAFATVLGTVSGLIVASSGAIAHDFIDKYLQFEMSDKIKVRAGKIAAFSVGVFAIIFMYIIQGNECVISCWPCFCRSCISKPACHPVSSVLEENNSKRYRMVYCCWDCGLSRHHTLFPFHVREIWFARKRRPHSI